MNSAEFHRQLEVAAKRLREAHDEAKATILQAREAEHIYRREAAKAYLHYAGTVAEREARVELHNVEPGVTVGDLRYAAKLADDLKDSAKELVKSRRQLMSSLQTEASLAKEEAAFDRTAPREVA